MTSSTIQFALRPLFITLVLMTACHAEVRPAPATQKYALRLGRPEHVGQRRHVVIDSMRERRFTTQTKAGVETKRETLTAQFAGTSTVVSVAPSGDAARIEYDVLSLVMDRKPLFKGGVDLIRAARESDAVITPRGSESLSDDAEEALGVVLTRVIGGLGDDRTVGSAVPRAIGERWSLPSDLLKADLSRTPGLEIGDVGGYGWIEGLAVVGTTQCLVVRVTYTARVLHFIGQPEKSRLENGSAKFELYGVFPLDIRLSLMEDRRRTTMEGRVHMEDGTVLDFTGIDTRERHFTPLPDGAVAPGESAAMTIRAATPAFRECTGAGRLNLMVVLDGDGRVSSAKDGGLAGATPELVACVVDKIRHLAFEPPGGAGVTVQFPLQLGER